MENDRAPLSLSETEPQIRMKRTEIKTHCINHKPATQSELPLKRVSYGGANSLDEENDATS